MNFSLMIFFMKGNDRRRSKTVAKHNSKLPMMVFNYI